MPLERGSEAKAEAAADSDLAEARNEKRTDQNQPERRTKRSDLFRPLMAEQVKADGSNLVFWPTEEAWRPDYWRSPNEATRLRT